MILKFNFENSEHTITTKNGYIEHVQTLDGETVTEGMLSTDNSFTWKDCLVDIAQDLDVDDEDFVTASKLTNTQLTERPND